VHALWYTYMCGRYSIAIDKTTIETKALNSLLAEYLVGPSNKCHQIWRGDEASIFSINVRLGDRTGQRASRSYVERDFVLYRFGNCLR
jgi:hypothetical protein